MNRFAHLDESTGNNPAATAPVNRFAHLDAEGSPPAAFAPVNRFAHLDADFATTEPTPGAGPAISSPPSAGPDLNPESSSWWKGIIHDNFVTPWKESGEREHNEFAFFDAATGGKDTVAGFADLLSGNYTVDQAAFDKALSAHRATNEKYAGVGQDRNFFERIIPATVGSARRMLSGYWDGKDEALAGAGTAAGIALAAGQLGPQVALPEEIATVPKAAQLGAKYGLTIGSAKYWAKIGFGEIAADLADKGIESDVIARVAPMGGIAYAAAEFLVSEVPGFPAFLKANPVVSTAIKQTALNLAKEYGKRVVTESVEEMVQQFITDFSSNIAAGMQNSKAGRLLVDKIPLETILQNGAKSFMEALGPSALMMAPGEIKIAHDAVQTSKAMNDAGLGEDTTLRFDDKEGPRRFGILPKGKEAVIRNAEGEEIGRGRGALKQASMAEGVRRDRFEQLMDVRAKRNRVIDILDRYGVADDPDVKRAWLDPNMPPDEKVARLSDLLVARDMDVFSDEELSVAAADVTEAVQDDAELSERFDEIYSLETEIRELIRTGLTEQDARDIAEPLEDYEQAALDDLQRENYQLFTALRQQVGDDPRAILREAGAYPEDPYLAEERAAIEAEEPLNPQILPIDGMENVDGAEAAVPAAVQSDAVEVYDSDSLSGKNEPQPVLSGIDEAQLQDGNGAATVEGSATEAENAGSIPAPATSIIAEHAGQPYEKRGGKWINTETGAAVRNVETVKSLEREINTPKSTRRKRRAAVEEQLKNEIDADIALREVLENGGVRLAKSLKNNHGLGINDLKDVLPDLFTAGNKRHAGLVAGYTGKSESRGLPLDELVETINSAIGSEQFDENSLVEHLRKFGERAEELRGGIRKLDSEVAEEKSREASRNENPVESKQVASDDGLPDLFSGVHKLKAGETPSIQEKSSDAGTGSVKESLAPETIENPLSVAEGQAVNTEPSEAQKEAENYKKAHVRIDGMDISIENPVGSVRRGVDEDGKAWESEMRADYGYIRGTVGYDKDHVDVFIVPGYSGGGDTAFVVNQVNPKTGAFDEHKVVLGAVTADQAEKIYLSNYEPGWPGGKSVVAMPLDAFKAWVYSDAPKQGAVDEHDQSDIEFMDMVKRYEEANGTVLNTDQVKLLFRKDGYVPTNEQSVRKFHPQAATLTGRIFDYWLNSKMGTGDNTVVFLGGGNGSGKSTISGSQSIGSSFVMDSTMANLDATVSGIEKALDAGFRPEVVFVYRDPVDAWNNGVLNRVEDGEHVTPKRVFANNHSRVRQNLNALVERFGEHLNVKIFEVRSGHVPAEITLEELRSKPEYSQEKILEAINEQGNSTKNAPAEEKRQAQNGSFAEGVAGSRPATDQQAGKKNGLGGDVQGEKTPWQMTQDEYASKQGASKPEIDLFSDVSPAQAAGMSEQAIKDRASQKSKDRAEGAQKYESATADWKEAVLRSFENGEFSLLDVYSRDSKRSGHGHALYVVLSAIEESGLNVYSPFKLSQIDEVTRSEYLDELEKDYRASKAGGTPAVRSKLPAKKTLKKAAGNPAEVRTMDDEGRVSDGKGGIHPGDVFRTSSGRTTTPYPNYSTKRVTKPMERAMHQWLIDNARAEAEARGDEFNVTQFGGMNADNFPPADGAAALMYLFGEQPSVVPSVTKPLVVQNQVTEKKTVRKAESVDAKLHRDSNVPASAKAKSMLGIPDDGKISADYGYLITTKNHHFDTEEEAREAAEFVLSDPDFSTNEQHGLKGLVRKRGDGDNPKVKVNVELRGRRYHLRSIHILNDAQYERQKSRSLDMEAGASAPIPDSSAEKASKEQKGVQPTPSAGKDTTSGGNVQEQKSKKSRRNNKAKPVDAGSGEWVSPLSEVDEIRFWRELDKVRIADYVPAESLRKVGRHWSYSLINGGESPALFNAKREALEAAEKHKQLFVDMYENPTGYDSALRLRAGKSLELIRKYKNQGKSEMEAGKLAQAEIERILNEAAEPKRQQSEAGGTPAVRSKLPAKKTLKKQEPGGFVSRVDGSDGFKILEVVDTREWVETKDDKWEAVSGSGQEHQCDRCGRNHEIHFWAIDRATKKKVCLGGSCVTESGMVNKSQHRTALAAARAVARHAAEIERLEDQIEAYDQAASTVGDAPGVESRMEENRFRNGRQVKVWSIGDAELFDHELRAVLRNVERESLERQWMRNRVAEKLGVEANSAQADKRVIESKLAAAKHKKSAAERRLGLLVEAEEKAEESGIVFGPDWFKQVRVKAQDGELSLEEFMKSADYIAENEALVKEVLNGMSKPDLDKAFNVSGWRSLGEIKKPAAVKKAYDNLLGWFEMGKAPTITSYSMDYFMDAEKKAALDAKERQERLERIHSVTEEDLKVYAEKAQEALTERRKAVEAHKAALENPQTLDDFSKVIRARGFHSMTAEQVERWDQLKADEAIDERKAARAGKAQVAQIANEEAANVGMTYTEGEHSKTGATLHIVSMSARVDRDAYKELAAKAKRLGGRWAYNSKYGNSPDGFNFKSKDAADEFMALQSGNVDRSEKVENDLRSAEERAADRLLEMADKWEAEGEESMGADRQTNTAKRAREAASAVESAVNQVKQARILRNVAAAVKSGDAKYLAGIRASTHLGALQREINRAKAEWNRLNPLDEKNMDYRQIEAARSERQHRAPTLEDIRVMQYPGVHVSEQPAKDLVLKLRHITGQKQFSQQLAKGITKDGINLNLEAAERIKAALGNETPWYISDEIAHKKRLMAMGLNHGFELRMAAREYLRHYEDGPTVDPMRQKLAEIQNKKYAGFDFFPTPEKTAREIAQWLDVEPGMTVLEPSAGLGALADAVKAEQPDVQIDVVEPLNDLREVLESKGYELIGRDFEEIEPADGQYDRIIMNPPFSKNRDIKHVQRAYDLLKPGGKLAAITSAHWTFANDRESQEFREWLGEVDGWQEDLGQVFNGKDALRKTGVNSVLVKIEKPAAAGGALRERSKIGFGFYSPIERAIEGFGQETFTPEQLKAMVAKAPGVKAEELDDLGWSEFLATKGTKVTKADALEFVRGGGVQLEEVVHRAEPELTVDNLPSGYRIEQIATNGKVRLYKRGGGIDVFDTEEDALEQAKYYIGNSGAADNTKYGKYTLSGGENYREVLLTLPVKPNKNELSFNDWLEMKGYDSNAPGFDESLAQDMYAEDVPVEMHPAEFNSSHWDESNVLAHVRLNDRRGPNGEKIMLVEEIQSDWHQEGRKSGYKKTHTKLPNGWVIKPAGNTWQEKNPSTDKPFELALYDESGQLKIGFRDGYTKSEALAYAIESLNKDEDSFGSKRLRTPNAPFKKSWAMLAFKRALKLAVDEGYDAIAWTPGEAQAERYDLSKQLDEVSIRKAGGTDVLVNGLRHGRVVVTKQTPLDKLDEVVGKELAQKAAADLETSDDVSYSGLSLKVGGSGMKGFYDKILPAEVGKYVRKMGGKVGTIGIAVDRGFEMADFMEWAENRGHNTELLTAESEAKLMDEWQADKNTTEVWNLPITDQMRGVVARGQALYERLDPERLGEYLEKRGVKDVETATEQLQLQWDEAAQKDGKLYETRVAEGASGKGVEAGAADARGKLPKKRGSDDAAARALMQPDNAEALRDAFESGEPVSSVIEQFVSGETPNMDWRGTLVRNARDFAALLMPLRSPYVESVKVAYLDKHKRIISARILSVGLLDSSLIDAQQIIRNMPEGTSGVIVAHNHPSGDPTPSKDDVAITNKIRAALNVFNVPLYDHIVTNGGTYCSLRDLGYAKLKHNELLDVDSPLGDVKVRKLPPEMRSVEAWERVPRRSLKVIADDTVIEGITKALRQADGDYGHAAIVNSVNALVGIVRLPLDLSAERAAAIIMAESSKMGGNAFFLDWPVSHTVENAAFINELLELADNEMNLPLIDVATLDKRAENVVREESKIGFGSGGKKSRKKAVDTEAGSAAKDAVLDLNVVLWAYETFGDINGGGRQLSDVIRASKELTSLVEEGRSLHRIAQQLFRDKKEVAAHQAHMEFTGGRGIATSAVSRRKRNYDDRHNTFVKALDHFDSMHQSWEWFLDKLSRLDKTTGILSGRITKQFSELAHRSDIAKKAGISKYEQLFHDKLIEIFGDDAMRVITENSKRIERSGVYLYNDDGKAEEFPLSKNEAYKYWQWYQDETLRESMQDMGYTAETMKEIEAFIGPEVLSWAKWQLEEFYPEYYHTINHVYRQLWYVNMPFHENYSPVYRYISGKEKENMDPTEVRHGAASMINRSLKARKENKRDFMAVDGDAVLFMHMMNMEHFKAYALPMRLMNGVFRSSDVQEAIKQYHGSKAQHIMNKFLDDMVRGGVDNMMVIRGLDRFRARFTKAVIGAKIPIFLKQLASIPAYAMDIPLADFAKGEAAFWRNPKAAIETLMQSEFMKDRYKRGHQRDVILAMQSSVPRAMMGKKSWSDKLMILTQLGDGAAIAIGGYAAYHYHYNKARSNAANHETAHRKALEQFEMLTRRTQQAGDVMDLGDVQRGSSCQKMFTMFSTSPISYYRSVSGAVRNALSGRGSRSEAMKRVIIGHFLLPMVFQFIANGFRWDDDDQKRAMLLGSFNKLVIVGEMMDSLIAAIISNDIRSASGITKTPFGDVAQDVIYAVNRLDRELGNGTFDVSDMLFVLDHIASSSSKYFGVPYEGFRNMGSGVAAAATDNTDMPIRRMVGFSSYALDD